MTKEVTYNSATLKDVLDNVRICAQLYCTKNGKVDSSEAESFLLWINEYTKYCKPEKKEDWEKNTRKLIYSPLVPKPEHENFRLVQEIIKKDNYAIINALYHFMNAGAIMQTYNDTNS